MERIGTSSFVTGFFLGVGVGCLLHDVVHAGWWIVLGGGSAIVLALVVLAERGEL